jgi:hypothetical protein
MINFFSLIDDSPNIFLLFINLVEGIAIIGFYFLIGNIF